MCTWFDPAQSSLFSKPHPFPLNYLQEATQLRQKRAENGYRHTLDHGPIECALPMFNTGMLLISGWRSSRYFINCSRQDL
jgi:hypothetical protein